MTFRARIRSLLLASSAVYILVGALALHSTFQLIDDERWVRHTHEVLTELQGILTEANQAESMTRGFVVTGSEDLLEGFTQLEQQIPLHVGNVARLTADNPAQQRSVKRLEALVAQRLRLLEQGVELRRRQGPGADFAPLIREGRTTMAELSRSVQVMSEEESRLLEERNARARTIARLTIAAISAGIVATLLIALLAKLAFARMVSRPVERLLEGVRQFSAGALDFRIPLPPGDELGHIAAALNQMAEQRHTSEETSRRLVRRMEAIVHASISIGDQASRADGVFRVLQAIVDWARELTGADYAALGIGTDSHTPFLPWVFSGMGHEVTEKLGHFPRPVGVLGWVARQGRVMCVENVHDSPLFKKLPEGHPDIGPFLGIPVRYESRSVGNLYLANKVGGAVFTQEDQRVIELLAAYAGGVIENSNLRQGLETERNRLRFLSQASESLARSLDYDELVRIIVGLLVPEFAEVASLDLLVEDAEGRWVVRAAERTTAGPPPRRPPQRIRFEPSSRHPVLRVIHSHEPLVLKGDMPPGLELPEAGSGAEAPRVREVMIVPLSAGGQMLGALTMASTRAGSYTPEDLTLARDLAVRAAVSLEHARLYREAQQALRSREEVLAVVSHDLRNPLNSILLCAQLLPRSRASEEQFTRNVEGLRNTANQMSLLIEDLVNAGAIEAGRLSLHRMPHDLESCLLGVVDMLRPGAEKKHQHLEVDLEPGLPRVLIDPQRMRQVVSNLLGNAIKYTGEHGTITLSARREGEELIVCIEDTGPGISAENLPRLFERYWRVRGATQPGTGLGLYIVKGIIEAHGGRTWAESQVGKGSRFFFVLSLTPLPAERERPLPTG